MCFGFRNERVFYAKTCSFSGLLPEAGAGLSGATAASATAVAAAVAAAGTHLLYQAWRSSFWTFDPTEANLSFDSPVF